MAEEHQFVQKMESFTKVDGGVIFHCKTSRGASVDIRLSVCTPHILRFQMCPDQALKDVKGLLEIKEDWQPCAFDVSETPKSVTVDIGAVRFEAQKDPWQYAIRDAAGGTVLAEEVRDLDAHTNYRSLPIGFTTRDGKYARSNETFALTPGEGFYGFGEKFTRLNKRGQRIHGWNKNPMGGGTEEAYKNIPFFMSTRGYGVFVNTTYRVQYDVGGRSLMCLNIMIDDPRLDLFIIYGPKLKDVLARYDSITGWPALPPKESFGIWHTPPWEGRTVEAAEAIARRFRDLDIPVDYFMIVWLTLGNRSTSVAESRELSEKLGKLGIKTGIYVAPLLNVGTPMEKEARAGGYAVKKSDGTPYEIPLGYILERGERGEAEYSLAILDRDDAWRDRHNRLFYAPCLMPDFTNPEAVKWWKGKIIEHLKAGCYGIGMSDFGEDIPADACYHNGHSGAEMHNIYTLLYQKATFEAIAEGSGHRGFVNARSGTAGMQKYPICWSGDPNCDWRDFLTDICAGLSIGLSGVPFWSCDNAGYQAVTGNLTPELWIRWSQWSMFQSHVRLHGTMPPRVPWTFGDRAVENFRKYAKLRYRLLPYIYSHAYNATRTGLPMMRAMVLEFQDDSITHDLEDQYMFGDAFLVAPVYTPVNKRAVYLPKGTWFDYWTAEEHQGPTTLQVEPPLETLPLYVRADSIVAMGPDMAYVGQKPFNPITLDTWLCSEAEATIYDDDEVVSCRARKTASGVVLNVSTSTKSFIVKLNRSGCPARVSLNGMAMPRLASLAELEKARLGWYFDPSFVVYAKFNALGGSSEVAFQV